MTATVNTSRLLQLDERALHAMSDADLRKAMNQILDLQEEDRKENQLLFYRPASPRAALVHKSQARVVGVGGGNGSGKSESVMAEICALASGVLPKDFREDLLPKFRGPVNCRIIVESLTTTLYNVILPKLRWWVWTGLEPIGGERGHWGWVPKACLIDGSWEKSWTEKLRTLRIVCRDPENPERVLGESSIQFMSHDQDPSDFASGDFHHVMMDEPPRLAIWRENEARTMRVGGRLYLSMTWPDDPSIPVDWIFDEIYERGAPGPNKAPDVDWFELWTTENRNLDQAKVSVQMNAWSETMKSVRIKGQPIRFSNRIHPLFTDIPMHWSFAAHKVVVPTEQGLCPETGSSDVVEFCHVVDMDASRRWPTVFVLDPHPRKPHMFAWFQVDPNDDVALVEEGAVDGSPEAVRDFVFHTEERLGLNVVERLIDPNMGRSPSSAIDRDRTWQDEFSGVGLNCSLADDSSVGRGTINDYLMPDEHLRRPRFLFAIRCHRTIHQMKRYVWDNYRRQEERAVKETPRTKDDDYPTIAKYFFNMRATFGSLYRGAPVMRNNRAIDLRTQVMRAR